MEEPSLWVADGSSSAHEVGVRKVYNTWNADLALFETLRVANSSRFAVRSVVVRTANRFLDLTEVAPFHLFEQYLRSSELVSEGFLVWISIPWQGSCPRAWHLLSIVG